MIAGVGDAVGAGGVEIAVGAFGFDDQRGGFALVELAIALWIADVDQQFDITNHVQVAARDVAKLHGAFLPIGFGFAQGNIFVDDEILYVAAVNARADFEEARFPIFAFPAVARVGIHAEAFVAVARIDEHEEIIGGHGGGAGMNFVRENEAAFVGFLAERRGHFHEAFLSFLD